MTARGRVMQESYNQEIQFAGVQCHPGDLVIADGNAREDAGFPAEALDLYDAAVRASPRFPRAHLNRGNALLGLGRTTDAADAYATAIACDPGDSGAHLNLGNAYLRLNRHAEAAGAYRRSLELSPDHVEAEYGLEGS